MIDLIYERAGIEDLRIFNTKEEMNEWIDKQNEFESITIIKIEEH